MAPRRLAATATTAGAAGAPLAGVPSAAPRRAAAPVPRRRAAAAAATATAALLVAALLLVAVPQPAQAQTASSWIQTLNMLLKPRQCANGKTLAVCRRDPCAVTACPTGFRCKADYCGSCSGLCEPDALADEADKARAAAAPTCELTGQAGKTAVRPTCSTPMCTFMQCGTGMACVNDFCGGCTGTCVNATDTMSPGGALKGSIQGSTLASVTACRAGEYMSPSGCRQCIPGSVSKAGSDECEMCQMGTFANAATNTCDKCAPGTASAALRATSCAPCNGGKYSEKEGSVMCSACKEGFTTPRDKKAHTSCVVAPPEPELPSKNATNPAGAEGKGLPEVDDAAFEEMFLDLEEKAEAALGGKDGDDAVVRGQKRAAQVAAEATKMAMADGPGARP